MKRVFKSYLLIGFIVASFFKFHVKADTFSQNQSFKLNGTQYTIDGMGISSTSNFDVKNGGTWKNVMGKHEDGIGNWENKDFSINKYTFQSNGKSYPGYCVDYDHIENKNVMITDGYKVDSILGEASDSNLLSYEKAITKIIKESNESNGSFTIINPNTKEKTNIKLNSDELYAATQLAINTISTGAYHYELVRKSPDNGWVAASYVNMGARWSNFFKSDADKISGCDGNVSCYKDNNGWSDDFSFNYEEEGTTSYKIVYAAQELFRLGLKKGASYVSETERIEEDKKKGKVLQSIEFRIDNAGNISESGVETINANFVVTGVPENSRTYINNLNFECTDCSVNGIQTGPISYKNKSGQWVEYNNENLIDVLSLNGNTKNGTISISIPIKRVSNEENCKNSKYTISYVYYMYDEEEKAVEEVNGEKTYSDDDISNYTVAKITNPPSGNCFVFSKIENTYSNENNQTSSSITPIVGEAYTAMLGTKSGTIKCSSSSSTEQEICPTDITAPECDGDAIGKIKTNDDIKKCILDNFDDSEAHNSYKLGETNGGIENNDYCSIFCKEDYDELRFTPKIKNKVCGGYFQLTGHIKGKKDCYTSGTTTTDLSKNGYKSINKDQFIKDVIKAQEEMIEAYDNYMNYTTAKGHIAKKQVDCGGSCDVDDCGKVDHWSTDYGKDTNYNGMIHEADYETGIVKAIEKQGTHISKSSTLKKCECKKNDGECEDISTECNGGTKKEIEDYLNPLIKEEIENMNNAYDKFQRIIKAYNACTTKWVNDFAFDPKIKYYYNEYHSDGAKYEPYYNLLKEESKYLEKTDYTESMNIYICTSQATNAYECSNPKQYTNELPNPDEWNALEPDGVYNAGNSTNKTYYSTGSIGASRKEGTSYSYELQIKDIDANKVKAEDIKINMIDYYNYTQDYQSYVDNRDKNLEMTNENVSARVSSMDINEFKETSLKKENFDFSIDDNIKPCSSNSNRYCITVNIDYKNANGVKTYEDKKNNMDIYFVPLKFNLSYGEAEEQSTGLFNKFEFTKCTDKGCEKLPINISQASFIRRSVEKEQSYITPTSFWQIEANGEVTTNGNYTGDKLQLEPIKNSLPISTKTIGGGIFTMAIEQLGEYYDSGKLGRLIDYPDSSNTIVINNAKATSSNSTGQTCTKTKTYYSTGYTGATSGVISYELHLKDMNPQKVKKIKVVNYSLFNQESDYAEYAKTRDKYVYMSGDDWGAHLAAEDYLSECPVNNPKCMYMKDIDISNLNVSQPYETSEGDYAVRISYNYDAVSGVTRVYYKNSGGYDTYNIFGAVKFDLEYESDCSESDFNGKYVCNYESLCQTSGGNDFECDYKTEECEVIPVNPSPVPDPTCPSCKVKCVEDKKGKNICYKVPPTLDPESDSKCPNCIVNKEKLNLHFSTISNTNFANNLDKRLYGYNWIPSTSIGIFGDKALETISDINSNNETIYEFANKIIGEGSELALSVNLTPEMINYIKIKNDELENVGGYANDSLTCYDFSEEHKNIFCYSDFIDDLINEYSSNITYSSNRIEGSKEKRNNRDGDKTLKSGYWKPWEKFSGNIYDENIIGGPSWR